MPTRALLFAAVGLLASSVSWAGEFSSLFYEGVEAQTPDAKIEIYTKAIAAFTPEDVFINLAPVYRNRGVAYLKKDDFDKAIADFNKAIEIYPQFAEVYCNRGLAYVQKEDFDKAFADFKKAIEINPQLADAYNGRGHAYFLQKDYGRAAADFGRVLEINPRDAKALSNRNIALQHAAVSDAAADIRRLRPEPERKSRIGGDWNWPLIGLICCGVVFGIFMLNTFYYRHVHLRCPQCREILMVGKLTELLADPAGIHNKCSHCGCEFDVLSPALSKKSTSHVLPDAPRTWIITIRPPTSGPGENIPPAAQPAAAPTPDDPLSESDVLSSATDPASCLSVARHYAASGRIQLLIDNYRGQPPAFHDAYGKAFLRLGRYDAVEALLASKSSAGPDDREIIRVMERAQRTLGVKSIFGAAQGFITKLTAAVELSQRKLHDWALWALDDDVLKTAAGGEAECMQAAEVYRAAGMVAEFLTQKARGQGPEFTGAYASAFYSLGDFAAALSLLKMSPRVEPERIGMYVHCHKATNSLERLLGEIPEDSRLRYAQALMDAAEDKAAFGVLSRAPRTTWSPEDFALALRLCDRLDDFKSAGAIFGDMQESVLMKDGPDLYYRYALICEKEGRIDLAQGIYEKLHKRFPNFRDVPARLDKLAALPAEDKTRLSTFATSLSGATPSLGAGAVPRELANKFELRKVLGIGGFGVVYKGFDRNLSRDVAIKVLNRRHQPDERARAAFLDEAKMVAALSHPYIVAIHEIVTLGEDNYLVFEFVDGEPLSKIVASRGSLGPKECVRALIFAAEALAYAHKSGVIHRDLKPGNLMWDKRGFVKVMDFGLAFQAGGKAASGGTLPYMAPEQHQSRGTEQSDVFALGATAYELLTGTLAFTGPDYRAQKNRERYAPLNDKVPPALRELVQHCLKADPAARPKGMAAVRTALRAMG